MPTKKPRVNVVLEPGLYKALVKVANGEGISISLAARDLIKDAVELYEDRYWANEAREREKTYTDKKALTHKEVWDK